MPFLEHLSELRKRLIQVLLGVCVTTVITYNWSNVLFNFLTIPIRAAFENLELIGTGPTDAFVSKLKVGLTAGLVLSSPWSFYQLWLFILPGMHEKERRFAKPFIALSTLCFVSGLAFCFYLVLPVAFAFFSDEFLSVGVQPQIRIGEYLGFVVKLCLVFGVIFELPIVAYFLARMGMLSHKMLLGNVRWAIVGIFIIAGILTPPDVVSQCLLAAPLLVIYGLCIGVTYYAHPDTAKKAAAEKAAAPAPAPLDQ